MSGKPNSLQEALEDVKRLLEELRGRGGLRHGLSYVRVSDLVEQARCEKRLEAIMGVERAIDERIRLVDQLVKLVLGAKRRIPDKIPKGILFLDTPLAGIVRGVPIVGRPRALIVEDGVVAGIVYASISKRPGRIYDTDRVRAAAFCAALLYSPLPSKTNPLYYHVKSVDRSGLAEAVEMLRERLEGGEMVPGVPGLHIIVCDEQYSLEYLEPLLAYWLGLRDARAKPGPWCTECPLREYCEASGSNIQPF